MGFFSFFKSVVKEEPIKPNEQVMKQLSFLMKKGNTDFKSEKYDDAISDFKEYIKICDEKDYKKGDYYLILCKLGECYLEKKEYGEAYAFFSQCNHGIDKTDSHNYKVAGISLLYMGQLLIDMGRKDDAVAALCDSCKYLEMDSSEDTTKALLHVLSVLYRYLSYIDRYAESLEYTRKYCEVLPSSDTDEILLAMKNIAICYYYMGRNAEAVDAYSAYYEKTAKIYKPSSIEAEKAEIELGKFCMNAGDFEKAEHYFNDVYSFCKCLYGASDIRTLRIQRLYGDALTALKRDEEAYSVHTEIYSFFRIFIPDRDSDYMDLLKSLVIDCTNLRKVDEADKYLDELSDLANKKCDERLMSEIKTHRAMVDVIRNKKL